VRSKSCEQLAKGKPDERSKRIVSIESTGLKSDKIWNVDDTVSNGAHSVAAAGDVDRRRAPRYSASMWVR